MRGPASPSGSPPREPGRRAPRPRRRGRGPPAPLTSIELAEAILARGDADLVAAARQTLADPDWFEKVRRGRGAEVRRCQLTNYCEALDQQHKAVTCRLWDRQGLDQPGAPLDPTGRRRLVAPDWNPEDD